VSVAVWHLCGQSVNEFLKQVVGRHDPLFLQIFRQKLDFSIRDLDESVLSDRWSSNVPRYISQLKQRVLDAGQSQRIIAMVCGRPPEGRARWSVRLIAEEAVKRKLAPKVGRAASSSTAPWPSC
jgi:hypothetical protein